MGKGPNPTYDQLFIRSSSRIVRVECLDALGRWSPAELMADRIDVGGLPNGIYHLRIFSGKGVVAARSFSKQ
ncbi:MAG: T9SS type A sorting domain-containing protein [Flavobacteriales bacterium]|nr:T9SS type A sorting domain-containing protein [Flavobacteriales bacterium]